MTSLSEDNQADIIERLTQPLDIYAVIQTNCWYSDGYKLCTSCSRFVFILLLMRFHDFSF